VETIGSKRSYALTWCMPNNDDDDDDDDGCYVKSVRFPLTVDLCSLNYIRAMPVFLVDQKLSYRRETVHQLCMSFCAS